MHNDKKLARQLWNWACRRENRRLLALFACLWLLFGLILARVQQARLDAARQQGYAAACAELRTEYPEIECAG